MSETIDIAKLSEEFPKDSISWRAQSVNRDGTKALALAYIDARDVMERLDQVVGPANWQDRYEVHGAKTICYLSVRIGGEWITKADGAGDSDVEAEKGAISDALKRAAVKWGVGRYLYALSSPWVPCETYEKGGKHYWSKWLSDPWEHIRAAPKALVKDQKVIDREMREEIDACLTVDALEILWRSPQFQAEYKKLSDGWQSAIVTHFKEAKELLSKRPAHITPNFEGLAQ